MKKLLALTFLTIISVQFASAEAIKLKNGVIINGSIVGRTEYILSVQTSYGTISINQREVDTIMPDLHRVLLKGGGEFVGTVLDLDEFNLSLKTDNGVVNLDTAQIASMDVYDYNEAEKQQKYVTKKIELEQEALSTLPAGASSTAAASAAASGSLSSSGLSFDDDLEKVFPSKPTVVEAEQRYNYQVHTFQGQDIKEVEKEEESELLPVFDEVETIEQAKKKDSSRNYFAVHAGGIDTDLKLDLSKYGGKKDQALGGTSFAFGVAYARKLTNRLWLGASLTLGLLPNEYVTIVKDNHEIKTSGQVIDFDVLLHFYLNPQNLTRVYLIGGGGLNYFNIDKNSIKWDNTNNYWYTDKTDTISNTNFGAIFGAGIERSIMDVNVGLELRGHYTPLSDDLEESRSLNYLATLKVSWFF